MVAKNSTSPAKPSNSTKPLRVKVPKSKERALIREFGLDVAALTEDEAAKRRNELRALVKMGKTRGFLTQQEVNDHLPEKLVDAEVLEAIVKMLNDGVVQKQVFSGYTAERKRPAQAGGMMVRNLNKSAAL